MIKNKILKDNNIIIAHNKRAQYDYFIEDKMDAGLVLEGWEVKSLRAKKVNISNSYILLRNNQAYLFGANFQPLTFASTHIVCNQIRDRKLLLNKHELNVLNGCINRKRYTIIAISLYWKKTWCKLKIGVARGKKDHDKRHDIKYREWQIDKSRIVKNFKY